MRKMRMKKTIRSQGEVYPRDPRMNYKTGVHLDGDIEDGKATPKQEAEDTFYNTPVKHHPRLLAYARHLIKLIDFFNV